MKYKYLAPIIFLACVVIYAYANEEPTELQKCQESYMNATNEIYRYNETHSRYKVAMPKYDCNETKVSTTGSVIPEPPETLANLHAKVCKKQINSPLCIDRKLFDRLYKLTEERLPWKNFYPILIGMTNAESSLGLNFAKDSKWGDCYGRNNWWGAKYMIKDDNTRVYKRNTNGFDYKYPRDQYNCNLFPFESIEEYWISKVNGIRYGYKGCIDSKTPVACISYVYVGNPKVSERSWVNNVSQFIN